MIEKSLRVLVVDDDPFMRDILALILHSAGCLVETAENGFEAFEKCTSDSSEIDVIISDMNMPLMSGLDLTRELRRESVQTPIILLTGDREVDLVLEAVESGANECLVKDENIQEAVQSSIRKLCENVGWKQPDPL